MRHLALISALLLGMLACGPRKTAESLVPPPQVLSEIPGNFTMKMTLDGESRYSTAVVKELPDGQYQIARITVYGPVLYHFNLGPDASVSSAELGKGAVSYQKNIRKLTIRFENEGGAICELSR